MADVKKEYEQIQQLVENCNKAIRRMDRNAHAFLKWIPLIYDAYTPSAAFERDVFNYYQLLGECGGYIWYSPKLEEHLQAKGCMLSQHKQIMFNYLREMRLFYAHKINENILTNLDKVCEWLSLGDEFERLRTIIESPSFNVMTFQQDDDFWESARQYLFDQVKDFLTEYEKALTSTNFSTQFINKIYKNALKYNYSNISDKDYLEYIILSWIDENLTSGFIRNPKQRTEAQIIHDKGVYDYHIKNLKDSNYIYDVLFKCTLKDYTPESVFRKILDIYYNQVLFKINQR